MQRLFLRLLVLTCLCTYPNLLTSIKADGNDAIPDVCYEATHSHNCSVYQVGDVASVCHKSDSFRINCSDTSQAYWDTLTPVFGSDADHLGPPALTGIYADDYKAFFNLTWNLTYYDSADACTPLLAEEASAYIPGNISLTGFASGSFTLSPYNHILLLNCSSLPPREDNTDHCQAYQQQCSQLLNTPCTEIPVPTQELKLHEALSNFSCTHFQFLVAAENIPQISESSSGLIQLLYTDEKCEACVSSYGHCKFNNNTFKFQQCECGNGKYSSATDCHQSQGCEGFECTKTRIAVGVSATILGTVIATLAVLWVVHRKRYSTKSFKTTSSNRLFTQRAYMLSKKFGPVDTKEFSFEILSKATKGFADENMIGDGGFGAVYYGVLKDGRKVAVKRLYHDNFKRMDHFYNEIQILSKINYPNLVKLYGFCCQDSSDLLLVFEYASNGTVSDQLHDATKPAMPWKTRLNIARETAEALSYLHNSVNPPIYHRDVKTTNILLDDELHAKLADFGLSRLVPLEATHVSTAPQGTPGYLDPDYHQCYQLTDKSDVYSFGVVLVELISAKLAVDMSRDRREINLSSLALMKIGSGQWEDLVDPRLEIKKNPDVEQMVKRVVELAFMCLNAEKDARPTMKDVTETLTRLYKEFDYKYDDDGSGGFSFKVAINGASPVDETSQLIKSQSKSESPLHCADSPPSSIDGRSSNASSFVNSF